jgi:hypothetical protein
MAKQVVLTDDQVKRRKKVEDERLAEKANVSDDELMGEMRLFCYRGLVLLNNGIPINTDELYVLRDWVSLFVDRKEGNSAKAQDKTDNSTMLAKVLKFKGEGKAA